MLQQVRQHPLNLSQQGDPQERLTDEGHLERSERVTVRGK